MHRGRLVSPVPPIPLGNGALRAFFISEREIMSTKFHVGQEIKADYPFVRSTYEDCSDGELVELKTWKPGINWESDGFDGFDACADANGKVVYNIVAIFKPGKFPERVFFVRNWIDPEGKRFGRNNLRITSVQNFRRLTLGYRHSYEFYDE